MKKNKQTNILVIANILSAFQQLEEFQQLKGCSSKSNNTCKKNHRQTENFSINVQSKETITISTAPTELSNLRGALSLNNPFLHHFKVKHIQFTLMSHPDLKPTKPKKNNDLATRLQLTTKIAIIQAKNKIISKQARNRRNKQYQSSPKRQSDRFLICAKETTTK